ncbi:Hypothetical predicted protein [Podarcis lilfordi]|uniref:Uncharacterized protein n=1 Tax=Podarcis lilfordi TaxID=74358 RepID=A0AA35QQN7_9SAUR|nr:Hypothetical predicted protein [Podarcis lilfordi]
MEAYTKLTDEIFLRILHSDEPNLKEARKFYITNLSPAPLSCRKCLAKACLSRCMVHEAPGEAISCYFSLQPRHNAETTSTTFFTKKNLWKSPHLLCQHKLTSHDATEGNILVAFLSCSHVQAAEKVHWRLGKACPSLSFPITWASCMKPPLSQTAQASNLLSSSIYPQHSLQRVDIGLYLQSGNRHALLTSETALHNRAINIKATDRALLQ